MHKVIVAILTYNLEKYIKQAIDSVLNQVTEFDYQIVIADDASTDGTCAILKQYEERYPEKIKVIYSDKNLGSLANSNRVFDKIQCEYFTLLDGDDYWVTTDRIQKQVKFLDEHREYSMCAGNTQYLVNDKLGAKILLPSQLNRTYTFDDFICDKMPFFHTSGIMVRNTIFINGLPECFANRVGTFEDCALRGEDFRRLIHLQVGPLYAMNEIVSHYRIHEKGIWQGSSSLRRAMESVIGYNFYLNYFDSKFNHFFALKTEWTFMQLMEIMNRDYKFSYGFRLPEKDTWLFSEIIKNVSVHFPFYKNAKSGLSDNFFDRLKRFFKRERFYKLKKKG